MYVCTENDGFHAEGIHHGCNGCSGSVDGGTAVEITVTKEEDIQLSSWYGFFYAALFFFLFLIFVCL